MKPRSPTFWLGLSSYDDNTDLVVSDRPRLLSKQTFQPDVQKPSLLVLVGGKAKTAALGELFGVRRTQHPGRAPGSSAAEVHLHVTSQSSFYDKPLLIAEGGLQDGDFTSFPQDAQRQPVMRLAPQATNGRVADALYGRLLEPFADVFCFFSDDLGGLEGVARHLAMAWLGRGPRSRVATAGVRPRIVVASSAIPHGPQGEAKARADLLDMVEREAGERPSALAPRVDVVALLSQARVSTTARHRALKERIMRLSDEVRRGRVDARCLFSLTHFAALLDVACDHFAAAPDAPFDLVRGSRCHSPVPENLDSHIANFLCHIKSPAELIGFAAPVIGSSLFRDAYPPGAHLFDPGDTFERLYADLVRRACSSEAAAAYLTRIGRVGLVGLVGLVKARFVDCFGELVHQSAPASEIHLRLLRTFKARWLRVHSTRTCLSCLSCIPQHRLPCGHVHCDDCVWDYGRPSEDDPWVTMYGRCHLCDAEPPEEAVIRRHPPTAGVGVFCLDGGGARGIVSLEILKRIDESIGLPIPLTRFIRVFFGISSGGLIAAEICLNGSTIDQAIEAFRTLAKRVFHRRRGVRVPFVPAFVRRSLAHLLGYFAPFPQLARLVDLLIWLCADGLYSPTNIEEALHLTFRARGILDVSHATSTGTCVGLPVATIDAKPLERIFTNYNGVGERHQSQDHVVRPRDGLGNVPLWEIGRAASAAPGFFPPKHIAGVGSFQDAGPLVDTTLSALCEVGALFPLLDDVDYLASIGTGESRPTNEAATDDMRDPWANGAIPRLARLSWEKMGDRKVRQVFQRQRRYHRLTVHFDGAEPMLDNARCMSDMGSKARHDPSLTEPIDHLCRCMIASLFYFELDALPERRAGRYIGTGTILCSLRRNEPGFRELFCKMSQGSVQIVVDGRPVSAVSDAACFDREGNFRRAIEVDTPGSLQVALREGSSEPCHIGRSPFTVERLVALQGLDAVFGRRGCRKRKSLYPEAGATKRRRAL